MNKIYKNIHEYCSHCRQEVILKNVKKYELTTCPNCGKSILPCSLCDLNKHGCRCNKSNNLVNII